MWFVKKKTPHNLPKTKSKSIRHSQHFTKSKSKKFSHEGHTNVFSKNILIWFILRFFNNTKSNSLYHFTLRNDVAHDFHIKQNFYIQFSHEKLVFLSLAEHVQNFGLNFQSNLSCDGICFEEILMMKIPKDNVGNFNRRMPSHIFSYRKNHFEQVLNFDTEKARK